MCAARVSDDTTMIQHRYLVLLSACLCQGLYSGIMFGTSPLLVGILDTFRTTRVQAGLVLSVMLTCFSATTIIAGALLHKYGTWFTGCLGSAVIAAAFGASFFATSVLYLIISVGMFAGFGLALLCISCGPTVSQHFSGRPQAMALTAVSVSGALGAMAISYGTGVLQEKYGIRGTCLLIGGFTLNGSAMSLLWKRKPSNNKEGRCERTANPAITNNSINGFVSSNNTHEVSSAETTTDTVSKKSLKEELRYVLTHKVFMLFAIANAVNVSAHFNASIYMVDAMQDTNKNSSLASLTPVLYNLSALFGRLMCGLVKFIPHCSYLDVAVLSATQGVSGCLVIALVDVIQIKLLAWCMNGAALGICLAGNLVTSANLLGSEHLTTGVVILLVIRGIMGLCAGPVNGYIRDVTGSYQYGLVFTSAVLLFVGVLYALAKVYRIKERSKVHVPMTRL